MQLSLDQIREALNNEPNLTQLAKDIDMAYSTLLWIRNPASNPSYKHYEKLNQYYGGDEK